MRQYNRPPFTVVIACSVTSPVHEHMATKAKSSSFRVKKKGNTPSHHYLLLNWVQCCQCIESPNIRIAPAYSSWVALVAGTVANCGLAPHFDTVWLHAAAAINQGD